MEDNYFEQELYRRELETQIKIYNKLLNKCRTEKDFEKICLNTLQDLLKQISKGDSDFSIKRIYKK